MMSRHAVIPARRAAWREASGRISVDARQRHSDMTIERLTDFKRLRGVTMKQKFLALKLYLVGMAIGLFIFGWSAIARTDSVSTATATTATANTNQIASNQAVPNSTRVQRQLNLQPIPSMPRIRTRTS